MSGSNAPLTCCLTSVCALLPPLKTDRSYSEPGKPHWLSVPSQNTPNESSVALGACPFSIQKRLGTTERYFAAGPYFIRARPAFLRPGNFKPPVTPPVPN